MMQQDKTASPPNALAAPDVAELQRLRALVAAQEEELFEWSATVQTVTAEATHRVQAVEAAAAAERRQFQAQIRSLQQEANLAHAAAAAAAEKTAEKAETIAVSAGNTCRLLPENWNMRPTQGSPVKVEPSRMRFDGLPCEIHVPRTVEATTTTTGAAATVLECDELASILAWHLSQNTTANRLPPLVAAWQQTLATQSTSSHRADFILSHVVELCIMSSSRGDDNEEDCEESLILMQQLLLATRLVPPRLAALLVPATADGTTANVSRIRWRGSAVPPTPRPPPKSLSLAGWLPVLSAWVVPSTGKTSAPLLQRAVYASQVLDWLLDSTCTASAVWTPVSLSTWQCAWMQRAHDLLRHHGAQPRPLRLLNNVEVVVHDPVVALDAVWTEQWLAASLTTWSRLPSSEQGDMTRNIMAVVVDLLEHVVLPERLYQSLLLPCLQWCSSINQQALYRTQFATDQSTPRRQWQRGPSLMAVLIRTCHDLVLQEKATLVPFRNAIIRFWDGLVRSIQVERHAAEQDGRRVVPFLTFVSEQYDFYVAAAALLLSAPSGSPDIQTMLRVQMEELAHDEEERDEIVVAAQFPTKKRRTRR
jgi:hypothetical protein